VNKKLSKMYERKRALIAQSQLLLDAADEHHRDLTEAEQATFDAHKTELDDLNTRIESEESQIQYAGAGGMDLLTRWGSDIAKDRRAPQARPGDVVFQNAVTGQLVKALKPTERFCENPAGDGQPFVVGRTLHAWLTGRLEDNAPNFGASQLGGSELAGGYLLEPTLSAMVIDLARASSVCLRAGASTVVMPTNELNLVRVDSDPTAHWRPEGSSVTASLATFGRVTLRSKTLAAIVPITLELLEDAANAPSVIESCVQSAIALKIDQACLAGSGAESEPLGVRNTTGVNTVSVGGIPTAYNGASEAVGDILASNYDGDIGNLAWVLHPRDGVTYDGLLSAVEGQPQKKTPWVEKLQQFYTTSIATDEGSGEDSYSIVGDFSQMLIGIRQSGVVVRRIPAGTVTDDNGTSYNAVNQLLEHLVVYCRVDVALMRPSWFSLLTGIQSA